MEAPEDLPERLNQFRKNLSDILTSNHTDAVLLKYLRVRNYDVKKAEINFREVDTNKKILGINTLLQGDYKKPEVMVQFERNAFFGFAKDGTAIRYGHFVADLKGFIMSMSSFEIFIVLSYFMEMDLDTLRQENKKTGRELNEITYVIDLDGFSLQDCMHKCVIESGMDFTSLVQDHYPESWKHVLLVNAPGYFYRAFNLLKPIFRPTLLDKIQVVAKHQTPELLRKYIDDDVLPAFLGGKRFDSKGDPKCLEDFPTYNDYVKIPKEYYVCNRVPLLSADIPGVQCSTVGARSVLNIPFRCTRAESKYRVRYRSEGGSLSTIIFFTDDIKCEFPTSNEPIVPYEGEPRYRIVCTPLRAQSHLAEIDGTVTLPWPGTYILQFDNTNSWFASRTLFYSINEMPSDS